MKFLKTLFLVTILIMALATAMSSAATPLEFGEEPDSLRGRAKPFFRGVRLSQENSSSTCDKNPMVCQTEGSGGPDCCKKKCVDFSTDILNCGKCGKKCSFGKICCEGKCVNPRSNKKHCGKCGNKCSAKGSSCVYGMCSYAS